MYPKNVQIIGTTGWIEINTPAQLKKKAKCWYSAIISPGLEYAQGASPSDCVRQDSPP